MRRTPIDQALRLPAGAGEVYLDVAGGMSRHDAIEAQEARGQREACRTQALPIDGTKDRTPWEKLGFVFGEPKDDLFVNVTFPAGWEMRPTEHSMHSDLVDENGHKRAGMFYKAAFYDRSANISLVRRFRVNGYAQCPDDILLVTVEDRGHVIKEFKAEKPEDSKCYEARDELVKEAKAWLATQYPEWEDPLAYWN